MIVSEKSHHILSIFINSLFKRIFQVYEKGIMSNEKMRNSDNHIYDFAHSLFGDDF